MTDDTQDIVARLRRALPMTTLYASEMWAPYKAADIIEEQAAEIEQLQQAIWQALDDMGDGYCVCPAAKDQMRGVLASIEERSHEKSTY